jgi:arsenate reductase-like glutaredoxin family protein
LRSEFKVDLDERDYARRPLEADELREIFKGRDPREFLNPKSPAYKAKRLAGRTIGPDDAIRLMVEEPNLLKRPLVIAGRELVAGFDRERLRELLG